MRTGIVAVILMTLLWCPGLAGADDMELEDINFAFDSKMVIDDLKQIPHLVDLLKAHPDTFLEISGHADYKGSTKYNQQLSLKRAEAVQKLLVDQGLDPSRIALIGYGEESPKAQRDKSRESRFINRRVVFSIYKLKDGQKDYYYKDNELIKPLAVAQAEAKPSDTSLDDLMKRIDELEKKLLESQRQAAPAEGCTQEEVFGLRRGSISAGFGSYQDEIAGLLDARLFFPFLCNFALQANAVGLIGDDVKEYEFSAGLIGKVSRIQIGAFGTFKAIRQRAFDDDGSLSQFAVLGAYLFDRGSIGVYFTEAINEKEEIGVGTMTLDFPPSIVIQPELNVANQFGVMFDYVCPYNAFIEGYAGAVHAESSEFAAGLKIGFPLKVVSENLNVFAQGNYNYGLIAEEEFAFFIGFEFSNWYKKKPVDQDIRPMFVPALSYGIESKTSTN
jgi:hypothetical protein